MVKAVIPVAFVLVVIIALAVFWLKRAAPIGTTKTQRMADWMGRDELYKKPAPIEATSAPPYDAEHPWRDHPRLKGRFHPDYPDDIQVIVHDGGPRMTKHAPEVVWVRVSVAQGDTCQGEVLNTPTQLESVRQGDTITFIVPKSSNHPIMVTRKYLSERPRWIIHGCSKCGFDELFDAPSDLMRVIFPNPPVEDAVLVWFTSFCPLCGGVQVLEPKQE
jgi:hypothetical protein